MDCNREEALRAKAIAGKKMESKDFVGARKIALKAQQLYADVENISQMLMVCDVHCAAEKKILGGDRDWYGILQVEVSADEATIKKQYRKFALQLHPDKNKFAGAEGAFKLIGEAQTILLDKDKRNLHDLRRGIRPSTHASWNTNVVFSRNRSTPSGMNTQNQPSQQPAHPGFTGSKPTFWTACPFCSVRYQYYREVINKSLRCHSCQRLYIACDMEAPRTADFSRPVFPQQMNNAQNFEAKVQRNFGTGNHQAEPVQNAGKNVSRPSAAGTGRLNRQREKKRGRDRNKLSDSESSNSLSSSDSEEDVEIDENGDLQGGQTSGYSGEQSVRRSSRRRQKVVYKENLSDDDDGDNDDFENPLEKAKGKRSTCSTEVDNGGASKKEWDKMKNRSNFAVNSENIKEDEKEVKQKEPDEECLQNGEKKNTDSSSEEASDSLYSYPDPDFSDFEKGRRADCFEAGQIWAAFDDLNAMPRFYARIKKVFSPGFKVQITWLEADPDDANEIKWQSGDLPFSCGKFKCGNSEKTDNLPMFSHQISWEKGTHRDTFLIYPRYGETWALFKDWDIKWNFDPVAHRKREYEYEFVEILSNYIEGVGVHVALLSKVKGFVSLFCRTEKVGRRTFVVPPGELLRFSHMIPSNRMRGDERKGVPAGSLELDPASLPIKLLKSSMSDHEVKRMAGCDTDRKRSHSQPQQNCSGGHSGSIPESMEIPEPIFYDFDADKSKEKFQVGQIWALYSDEDGLPKYYGQVTKVDSSQNFKLRLSWLASCSRLENIRWSDPRMPTGCGRFKINKSASQAYDCNGSFSHLVRAELAGKKNEYTILPRKGEVWALYRNWSADIKCSDLKNCEYDIVAVLAANDSRIDVLVLCRVDGFNSVFKPRVHGGLNISKSIPQAEFLKFSHQIPAFRLTDERGGKLRGFWELDPAAMPIRYFRLMT